jgi:hypothetical protein
MENSVVLWADDKRVGPQGDWRHGGKAVVQVSDDAA